MSTIDYASLYEEYYPKIFLRLKRILRNKENAENIANDVFERFYKKTKEGSLTVKSENGPGALLYKMASNLGINFINRRKKETELNEIYAMTAEVCVNDNAEEIVKKISDEKLEGIEELTKDISNENLRKAVTDVLNESDEKTKIMYIMLYHDGITLEKIGKALGLAPSTIHKRHDKFRYRVREILGVVKYERKN